MPLRPYQQTAHDLTLHHLNNKDTNGIVVVATGGGKSHNIEALAERIASKNKRVVVLAHRKELLEQNSLKFGDPSLVGIYSAGLGIKQLNRPVTIAGIQSIYNKDLPHKPDVILVDECHLVGNNQDDNSMYWQFLNRYKNARIIGYTATPYRTSEGMLGWGEIICEVNYNQLCPEYLAPLTYKMPEKHFDTSGLKVRMGDYIISDMEKMAANMDNMRAALEATLKYGQDRKSWMIFCISVAHAEAMTWMLKDNGVNCEVITGNTSKEERARIIQEFKNGKLRCLLNVDVLTTGFDAPNVDMLVILRPTMSAGLHEQILGRGCRKAENKTDCLVVDLAWNTIEHGMLGDVPWRDFASSKAKKPENRICPNCESLNKLGARECLDCGYVWPVEEASRDINHHKVVFDSEQLLKENTDLGWFDVGHIDREFVKSKKTNIPMMKVIYNCGNNGYTSNTFYDYVCLGHDKHNYAFKKALQYMRKNLKNPQDTGMFHNMEPAQAVAVALKQEYKTPTKIKVEKQKGNSQFTSIVDYDYTPKEPEVAPEIEDVNVADFL